MERTTAVPILQPYSGFTENIVAYDVHSSGVSWGAVIAGAFVAAALSLILLALGAGLGLSVVTPWSVGGASAATIGKGAVLWLILMEIMASSMCGYLAGRLRTKWQRIHTDEVYFRDTAHGFLAWAVGLVVTAAFLASASVSMVGGSVPNNLSSRNAEPSEYFTDMMLRGNSTTASANDASLVREVGAIIGNGLRHGALPESDKAYLSQLVTARTGMSEPDAQKRVADVFVAAQQATDLTRKAVAHSLLWMFVALLIGAFCASVSATLGGDQRDHVVVV